MRALLEERDYPVAINYRSYSHITGDYSLTIVDEEPDKTED